MMVYTAIVALYSVVVELDNTSCVLAVLLYEMGTARTVGTERLQMVSTREYSLIMISGATDGKSNAEYTYEEQQMAVVVACSWSSSVLTSTPAVVQPLGHVPGLNTPVRPPENMPSG